MSYVVFDVGEMRLALEIEHVLSAEPMLPITPVPDMPLHLAGVVNLRGNVTAVVDLAQINGQPASGSRESDCILMVSVGGYACGLLASSIGEVHEIAGAAIVPPLAATAGPRLFRGFIDVDSRLVGILDTDRLFTILTGDTDGQEK